MSALGAVAELGIAQEPSPAECTKILTDFDQAMRGDMSWLQFVEPKPAHPLGWKKFGINNLQVAGLELCGLDVYAKWHDGFAGEEVGYSIEQVLWHGIDITAAIEKTTNAMEALTEQVEGA